MGVVFLFSGICANGKTCVDHVKSLAWCFDFVLPGWRVVVITRLHLLTSSDSSELGMHLQLGKVEVVSVPFPPWINFFAVLAMGSIKQEGPSPPPPSFLPSPD